MKIEFLGTGAADWHIDRRDKEPDFRRNSSVLVDGTILIDPGPHIYDYLTCENKPDLFQNVKYVLVTHSHPDHYCVPTLLHLYEETKCELYATPHVNFRVWNDKDVCGRLEQIRHHRVEPLTALEIGDYRVLPLSANHSSGNPYGESCIHYLIEKDGRSLFYGLDGGWLSCEEWNEIRKRRINCFVFDATVGYIKDDWRIGEHSNLYMVEMLRDTILKNCAAADTTFYVSHLARTLHRSRKETEALLLPKQMIPAYDGMIVEV